MGTQVYGNMYLTSPPCEYVPIYVIFLETTTIGLHFAADNIGMHVSSMKFFWWAHKILFISARVTFQPFKVIQGH